MNIAICEDDKAARDYEALIIRKWALNKNLKVTIDIYSSAENFIFESEDKSEYDLLMLDIQMGKMNGFELAKSLRSKGYNGQLAFLTGIIDYAVEGYEVGAVRYILKPVKEENLFNVLDTVYSNFAQRVEESFILEVGNDVSKIPFNQIVYVEARGHYVHLCGLKNGEAFEKEWKSTFGSVTEQFEKQKFFYLRRGLLVNLYHVQKITKTDCILDTNEILPVARNNYDALNKAFIDYYKEAEL